MSNIISASTFHTKILRWYSRHQRSFAWRTTRHPYKILLSEIMSQQTQVGRVADYYSRWLKQFPTIASLANASTSDVLRAWSGLGYNSRALRFHRLAKIVTEEYRSRLPRQITDLLALPGIGKYTAHAVACFAYGENVPVVDVNIRRILTRVTTKIRSGTEMMPEQKAWDVAAQFLPKKKAFEWNQSLMDLGAMVCTARRPKCDDCPIAAHCRSAFSRHFLSDVKKIKKAEPSWRGIPRRLYRGKILKMLHHHPFSAREIAGELWSDRSSQDIRWTESVLEKMVHDGLLSKRNGKYSLA